MKKLLLAVILWPMVSYGHHISYVGTYCKQGAGTIAIAKVEAFDSKTGERLSWWTARTLEDPDIGMEAWMQERMDDWDTHMKCTTS